MKSLLNTAFNWPAFAIAAIFIRIIFLGIDWPSYFAVMISVYQFILLFNSIGHVIPVRYLLGSFMCVQFLLGPTFAYNGLDEYQYFVYKMAVPEVEYFIYAIPAVLLFIVGLHLNAGKLKGESVDQKGIILFVRANQKLPYIFIILGFTTSVISSFFSSELAFIFYLLGSFKFIGLFLLVLGNEKLKKWPLVIVMGSIVSSSLGEGMFHDLLTWIIFTASVFAIKYKFDFKIKIIGAAAFLLLAALIQVMKGSYRQAIGSGDEGGVETFARLAEENNTEEKGVFSYESLAKSNVRINQGFIITNIMTTVPLKTPYENGAELYRVLEAAVFPRFIIPDKLRAGDRQIFMKYSGIQIQAGTSMGLSSLGDAYINYGIFGGCIFMFILGLVYSEILNLFGTNGKKYPILILFTALVFYYPIRPDCELQTILGHVVKSCFLIAVMIHIWSYNFRVLPLYRRQLTS